MLISLGADPEVVTPAAGAGGFVALLLAIALQIAATIYMIVLLARRGEPGPNAWGPPPG